MAQVYNMKCNSLHLCEAQTNELHYRKLGKAVCESLFAAPYMCYTVTPIFLIESVFTTFNVSIPSKDLYSFYFLVAGDCGKSTYREVNTT